MPPEVGRLQELGRYARTVRHLRPEQVAHRARLRAQRKLLAVSPGVITASWRPPAGPPVGWPCAFRPVDADVEHCYPGAEANAEGRFELLGERHDVLRSAEGWRPSARSQLFRYHLHYLDWAWAFHQHPDLPWARGAFATLWRSWRDGTRLWRWDEWSPYVVSLRAWNLCGLYRDLVHGSEVQADVLGSLADHLRFLRHNVERDVGGNHLVKNLKALVGLGVFWGDERVTRQATDELLGQLDHQVLGDGGHYELSPSYHAQVLADLVDVRDLLGARGGAAATLERLDVVIVQMQRWLLAVLQPDGSVPLVGDSVPCHEGLLRRILPAQRPDPERFVSLPASGYHVYRPSEQVYVLMDLGRPCPRNLPAHAQADFGTFLLWVDQLVVCDPGVSAYTGLQRHWERSTRAHNTLVVDDVDQTEVWGLFRAGRRAAVHEAEIEALRDGGVRVAASHDGYRHLPGAPIHRRTFSCGPHSLHIHDAVGGAGRHRISCGLSTITNGGAASAEGFVAGPASFAFGSGAGPGGRWEVTETARGSGFGRREPAMRLQSDLDTVLPWEQELLITW